MTGVPGETRIFGPVGSAEYCVFASRSLSFARIQIVTLPVLAMKTSCPA